ncbi:hypothetical protein LUZ60_012848 [Juncus effusus]|nr:hypothetical protein LUZ60_012848 [Juncus effusus]
MAPSMHPSSPTQSDQSISERQKIYLSQHQKQQLNLSSFNKTSIVQNMKQFDHLSSFQPIDEKYTMINGQVYDPIKSLINGWPNFNTTSSTSLSFNESVTMQETSAHKENLKKRKCDGISNLKVENGNGRGNSSKRVKEDYVTTNEEKDEKLTKGKNKKESENSKQNTKASENSTVNPKLDYIHVRARRGQATDSHSLAERVRRERISERMRHLQELVPGCNKVTGKAGMLDEIINYVQSLQRQVEFLSMKLATVNPMAEINIEDLIHRQMNLQHDQLNPSFLQFNQCFGIEMAMDQPNGLNPIFNGSMPDPLVDPFLNVNNGSSSNWDVGFQNLYGLDPNQAKTLGFPFQ